MKGFDVAVVGGGIVGLATAMSVLRQWPGLQVVVLEKEAAVGEHQTSHNSGVLHSGIYYRPGSLRARLCVTGRQAMVDFCRAQDIAHEVCGKVIVATDDVEVPALRRISERGLANGVPHAMVGAERLRELEPHARGVAAIHVPDAGIADFGAASRRMAEILLEAGGEVRLGVEVSGIDERPGTALVESTAGEVETAMVITCGGLQSDRLASMTAEADEPRVVPFRGEYFALRDSAKHLCRNLIYPVPDPALPFLGVHLTRRTTGIVDCGPNAVLGFAREGYRKGSFDVADVLDYLGYPGFWRLAATHVRTGVREFRRSVSRKEFARAVQKLVPELSEDDLVEAPAGIRAQAVDRTGSLVDEFVLRESRRVVHVCNAPSPAATASIAIGDHISGLVRDRIDAGLVRAG